MMMMKKIKQYICKKLSIKRDREYQEVTRLKWQQAQLRKLINENKFEAKK